MDILKCTITKGVERSNAIIILAIKNTEHFVYKSNKNERGRGASIHCSSTNEMNAHMLALNCLKSQKKQVQIMMKCR